MKAACLTIFLLLGLGSAARLHAQPLAAQDWETQSDFTDYNLPSSLLTLSNNVVIKYGNAVLVADEATLNKNTGEVNANGRVRIQSDDMVWVGEHVSYNFITKRMEAREFRAGKAPMFAGGEGLSGNLTNKVYTATNGYITLDDYDHPFLKVRAKRLTITPGDKFVGHGTTLRIGSVPVFYLPWYSQRIDATAPAFTFTPGYKSRFGGYVLGGYEWKWDDFLTSKLHLDYRTERGPGAGADLNLHLGNWGEALVKYYYLYDLNPETNTSGADYPHERQRVEFNWLASPYTNTTFKSRVSFQSDDNLRREFFEGEYKQNIQPSSFVEARHFWDNFSLSAIGSPQVNDFFETVERLPEVKLTAFRQQIGASPFYYESESRAGYLRRVLPETNTPPGLSYEAARADTYHQIVLPVTLFGWLNITPRAGGRFTYYSEADGPGATSLETNRSVFNTGAEVTTKASRTWAGVRNGMFDMDGLRHIVEPSANYVYVPRPSARPGELPQFDHDLPNLNLLPIDFPDYNAIDAVDSQNVIRWGLRNRLQTKRAGEVVDLLDWDVFTDWRLNPEPGQKTFSDISSDLKFHPRSWLALESRTRYDLDHGQVRMAFNSLTLQPDTTWNLKLGYFYLRDDFSAEPTAWGAGNNLFTSTLYLRVNENWGLRVSHYYDLIEHQLEQQTYTVYRDFRSWTGALSFRVRENVNDKEEFTIAFTFSLKALPRFSLGEDTIQSDHSLGY